jgi:hypothetical protein
MTRHIQAHSKLHGSNTDGNKSRIFRKTEMDWKKKIQLWAVSSFYPVGFLEILIKVRKISVWIVDVSIEIWIVFFPYRSQRSYSLKQKLGLKQVLEKYVQIHA